MSSRSAIALAALALLALATAPPYCTAQSPLASIDPPTVTVVAGGSFSIRLISYARPVTYWVIYPPAFLEPVGHADVAAPWVFGELAPESEGRFLFRVVVGRAELNQTVTPVFLHAIVLDPATGMMIPLRATVNIVLPEYFPLEIGRLEREAELRIAEVERAYQIVREQNLMLFGMVVLQSILIAGLVGYKLRGEAKQLAEAIAGSPRARLIVLAIAAAVLFALLALA